MTVVDSMIVESTNLSYKWLEQILERECDQKPEIQKVSSLGDVLGMMSTLRRVNLRWGLQGERLPASVVVKLPCVTSSLDAIAAAGTDAMAAHEDELQRFMHDTEAHVYEWFRNQSERPIASPRVFASFSLDSETPSIVMEDLGDGQLADVHAGFSERQLFAIAEELAKFHAYCYSNDSWKEVKFAEKNAEMMSVMSSLITSLRSQLQAARPDYWSCLDIFQSNAPDVEKNMSLRLFSVSEAPLAVVAHGDLWCPQIIWRGDRLAAILDWQAAHPGSMVEDISRVLATSTKTELRRNIQKRLFDRYFEVLEETLRLSGRRTPFERQFLDEEYIRILPYTLTMTLFACAMWSRSPVLKRGDDGDQKRIDEIFCRTRAFFEDSIQLLCWR